MSKTKQTYQFKTEMSQLLDLIINSLYSHQEIFLRELISNASDAIDRLRYKAHTQPELLEKNAEFKIRLIPDKKNRTLQIVDNGMGMSEEELKENIGTIAKSGTGAFLEAISKVSDKNQSIPELIGQFGVGFYSAFMVADKVAVVSRSVFEEKAYCWESDGRGEYSLEETTREEPGTTVTLFLKKVEEGKQDFLEEWVLRSTVKKHSDFVSYPVVMDIERNEPVLDKDGKPDGDKTTSVVKEETFNSMKAIWARDKNDVKPEEYTEFYKHISHDWNDPLANIHIKLEGVTEYQALLYIPGKAPMDLFHRDHKHGVNLYSRRIFIMENCKDLMPEYLRFVKGVVDAPDFNLNVSREMLQQDNLVTNIRKNLVKKVFDQLTRLDSTKYEQFWGEFGSVIKEGAHSDYENKDKISDLLRYKTTKSEGKWISLATYVGQMAADQKEIYYITGENGASLMNSPLLEGLKAKDYEVLLMTDPVDEWVIQSLTEYKEKKLKSAEKGDLEIDKVDEKQKEAHNDLLGYLKTKLEADVKDVKPSVRLKGSVSCLAGENYDMSGYMEKIMQATGQAMPENKRVLEVNLDHPVVGKMQALFQKDKENPILQEYATLLFDLAVIGEGGKVKDPTRCGQLISNLMVNALEG